MSCLGAIDFTTVEVWTPGGLVTFYLLFVMKVATRKVEFVGLTVNPNSAWIQQIGRNLIDCEDGFLLNIRYLLMDRDKKFTKQFRDLLESSGVNPVRLPARSPNLNSHIERFMLSIKTECLNWFIFFGRKSLEKAVSEYLIHYHRERCHQGLGNNLIEPGEETNRTSGGVCRRERLGGLLNYYYRRAA